MIADNFKSGNVQQKTRTEAGLQTKSFTMNTLYNTHGKSSNAFNYELGRRRECPVCNGERNDCRSRGLDNGSLQIHCRSLIDSNGDWSLIKIDALGFGIYGHEDDRAKFKQKTAEEREELFRKEREEKHRRLQREKELAAARLIETDRDREIRKILDQLTLSAKDKEILLKRKFLTEDHIKNCRTIKKFQSLSVEIDPRLAGVNAKGTALNNGHDGILFPIRNENGLFVGLRVYDPNAATTNHGKYVWLSSSNRQVTNKYRNEENPIAIYYPKELKHSDKIGLCEGYEFKPQIAADRLGYPVIGLGGASAMSRSPFSLNKAISAISKGLPRTLVLIPDANSPNNGNVWRGQLSVLAWLELKGYPHLVAWWGQFEKFVGDIDEIDDIKLINYIEPSEYLKFSGKSAPKPDFKLFTQLVGLGDPIADILKSASRHLFRKGNKFYPYTKPQHDQVIKYKPGDHLPTLKELDGRKLEFDFTGLNQQEAIEFKARTYERLAREGVKIIYEQSPTGSGKSYLVGELNPSAFFLVKEEEKTPRRNIFYTSQSPRNPVTIAIEKDFVELPTRHEGFVTDSSKLTPLGNPMRYRPQRDDIETELLIGERNCRYTKQLIALRQNGQDKKEFCKSCPLYEPCQKGTGNGYGFLWEMKIALSKTAKKRGHTFGIGADMVENAVFIADDNITADSTFKITANEQELTRILIESIQFDARIGASIATSFSLLIKLLKTDGIHKKHGYNTSEILEALGQPPANIAEIISSVNEWECLKNTEMTTADEMGNYPNPEPKFLSRFLEIWASAKEGKIKGGITSKSGKITLEFKNPYYQEIKESAHCSIVLDATSTTEYVATRFNVNPKEIYWVSSPASDLSNITIQPVDMGCKVGKERSGDLVSRLNGYRDQAPIDEKFIEYKDHAREGDLCHFSDARGSNLIEGSKVLNIFGIPRPNIGAKLSEYIALTGRLVKLEDEDEGFTRFYKDECLSMLIQEFGRLRANRYTEEQFLIRVWDNEDLSELRDFGYKVNPIIPAAQICKESAPPTQATLWDMAKAIGSGILSASELSLNDLHEKLKGITQKSISDLAGKSIGRIKQLSAQLSGGWKSLLESLSLLYWDNKGLIDFHSELEKRGYTLADIAFLEKEILPLAASSNLGQEQDAWDDIECQMADETIALFSLTPFQRVRFILAVIRKLFDKQDIPLLLSLLAPETEFV